MAHGQVVQAIYKNGVLQLLQPVNFKEGAHVWVEVTAAQRGEKSPQKPLYPTRPQPAETLARLSGLVAIGGDALEDTEALYDTDCD